MKNTLKTNASLEAIELLTTAKSSLDTLISITEQLCDAVENMNKLSPSTLGPSAISASNDARSTIASIKERGN